MNKKLVVSVFIFAGIIANVSNAGVENVLNMFWRKALKPYPVIQGEVIKNCVISDKYKPSGVDEPKSSGCKTIDLPDDFPIARGKCYSFLLAPHKFVKSKDLNDTEYQCPTYYFTDAKGQFLFPWIDQNDSLIDATVYKFRTQEDTDTPLMSCSPGMVTRPACQKADFYVPNKIARDREYAEFKKTGETATKLRYRKFTIYHPLLANTMWYSMLAAGVASVGYGVHKLAKKETRQKMKKAVRAVMQRCSKQKEVSSVI